MLRSRLLFFLITMMLSAPFAYSQKVDSLKLFFKLSDYYLKRHVYNGLVNYKYTADNFGEMDLLHQTLGKVDLTSATVSEKKAFYINAYNILVIYQVAKSYPLNKPSDKEGFFDNIYHNVAGERMTLNELEKVRMIQAYKDPRFHFVLACAAMSCPKLHNQAYMPENVEKLLDERTRVSINDANFIRLKEEAGNVEISKIFEWYAEDFTSGGQQVLGFINRYRDQEIPSSYSVSYYTYDWLLNERK